MVSLSNIEIFKLGLAYGSFSVGEIDQGIHIVLPVLDEGGVPENGVFIPLFEKYLDKIPRDLALGEGYETYEELGEIYMGAIEAFIAENQLGLILKGDDDTCIKSYERAIAERNDTRKEYINKMPEYKVSFIVKGSQLVHGLELNSESIALGVKDAFEADFSASGLQGSTQTEHGGDTTVSDLSIKGRVAMRVKVRADLILQVTEPTPGITAEGVAFATEQELNKIGTVTIDGMTVGLRAHFLSAAEVPVQAP